jgi:hypothetical protein
MPSVVVVFATSFATMRSIFAASSFGRMSFAVNHCLWLRRAAPLSAFGDELACHASFLLPDRVAGGTFNSDCFAFFVFPHLARYDFGPLFVHERRILTLGSRLYGRELSGQPASFARLVPEFQIRL